MCCCLLTIHGTHEKLTAESSLKGWEQIVKKSHLDDVPIRTVPGFLDEFYRRLKSEKDDFRRTVNSPQLPRYLKAIHYGHRDVQNSQLRMMRLDGSEGRSTIFSCGDNSVGWSQQLGQYFQDFSIVVSDKDGREPIIEHERSPRWRTC
jgi:hypothetical protein